MIQRFVVSLFTFALGVYLGFASGASYAQLITASALFHSVSIGFLIPGSRNTGGVRAAAAVGISVNALFLIELVARYFFETRLLG